MEHGESDCGVLVVFQLMSELIFGAPPPDRHAIRLPAVRTQQLDGTAQASSAVKSPSCGLSTYGQAC